MTQTSLSTFAPEREACEAQPETDPEPVCCPWCFGRSFRENPNGTVGCLSCEAVQPVEQEWYQNGEKIAI